MAIAVRRAVVADVPALVDLMEAFYAESQYGLDRQWANTVFRKLLDNPALGAIWLSPRDGRAAGYVVLTIRFSMEHGGLDAFIDDLFVRPGDRRHGLGRALLDALFAECRSRGVLAVHVEVGEDNAPAKTLYAEYGMATRKDRREFLTIKLDDHRPEVDSADARIVHGELNA